MVSVHIEDQVVNTPRSKSTDRYLVWIDAVGCYLLCLSDEITIGQAIPEAQVDVPIMGDLSRRHGAVRRTGENYLLIPVGPTRVGERPAMKPTPLVDGAKIRLGRSVTLQFRRPHPLSLTALLKPVDSPRIEPACSAVLLMAQSCIFGPGRVNHVVCPDWGNDLVLFRQNDRLLCQSLHPLEVDGRMVNGPARLRPDSRIVGEDFALRLEPA